MLPIFEWDLTARTRKAFANQIDTPVNSICPNGNEVVQFLEYWLWRWPNAEAYLLLRAAAFTLGGLTRRHQGIIGR